MIISKTPLRISFVGGGSDIKTFYEQYSGAVVSTTINKYIYITVNKKFDDRIRVSYSITENVNNVRELRHNLVRECLNLTNVNSGIEITSISDIPSEGTGLGSSSAYVVGLLNALYRYKGWHILSEKLAQEACKIEIDILKKPVGKQDQYIVTYGGLNYIQFNSDNSVYVEPIICSEETINELESNLLLFFTDITRSSDKILFEQKRNIETNEEKLFFLQEMVEVAQEMKRALQKNELNHFGEMLHRNWLLKKKMANSISSPEIDYWYDVALKNGALGGKILGAGNGGFLLFYAPGSKHKKIIKALSSLRMVQFKLQSQGSKIIYADET